MKTALKQIKRILSISLIALLITVSSVFTSPEPAFASLPFNFAVPKQLDKILSNKELILDAKNFLNERPEAICEAYFDKENGINSSTWAGIEKGATSALTIAQAVTSASAAGAGPLAGYAGIASAVSHLGLGSLTTTIAGMMGSSATGAAATAVVTSAVGGPLVMGTLLVGGTGATIWGTYELSKFTFENLGNWAENYCLSR